jgi:2-polyprenyl-6-methoxyphenol hydroxylase-like FAD-dependent oxidoreductase
VHDENVGETNKKPDTESSFQTTQQQSPRLRVLIVGAGLGGIALANAIDFFCDVCLVEKRDGTGVEGSAIGLPANSVHALELLGYEREIKDTARQISQMAWAKADGVLLSLQDLTRIHPAGAQFMAVARRDLHRMLLERATVPINFGTTVNELLLPTTPDAPVTVRFSSPVTRGGIDSELHEFDLVVGADGMYSRVRDLVHAAVQATGDDEKSAGQPPVVPKPIFRNARAWRTLVYGKPNWPDYPIYLFSLTSMLMLYPINSDAHGERYYIYAHEIIPKPDRLTAEESAVRFTETFSKYGGVIPEVISNVKVDELSTLFLESISEIYWGSPTDRVVLLGDAAHGIPPFLQNGAAQAFEDVYTLARLLEKAVRCAAGAQLAKTAAWQEIKRACVDYVDARHARVGFVVRESNPPYPTNEGEFDAMFKDAKENGSWSVSQFHKLMNTPHFPFPSAGLS